MSKASLKSNGLLARPILLVTPPNTTLAFITESNHQSNAGPDKHDLRMTGVEIDGPSDVFCDDQSVMDNSTLPELQLKKKNISICYHHVRECCAEQAARILLEPANTNLADLCAAKALSTDRRKKLCHSLLC